MIKISQDTAEKAIAFPPPSEPLRLELLGDDKLTELARQLATFPARVQRSNYSLLKRLRENEGALQLALKAAAAATELDEQLMPDAEWLLDNFFVIESVLQEVHTDLPRGFYDELPLLESGPSAELPRIYGIAEVLVSHTDSHLDEAQVLRFVLAFQEVAPLKIGELWAIPTMLRLALLENLRRLGDQMRTTREERNLAMAWVRQAVAAHKPPALPENPSDAFLVGWHQAVRDLGDGLLSDATSGTPHTRPSEPLNSGDWLARHATGDLSEVLHREYRRQASNQVSIGNCITSLRLLSAVEWNEFFEQASLVEAVLRSEPTGDYRRQDFATRNQYRQAIELLAKAAKRDELEVAHLTLARASRGMTGREKHIGYYLIAEGRREFARALNCRFTFKNGWRTALTNQAHVVYFGSIASITLGLIALAVGLSSTPGASFWLLALVAVAILLPASDAAIGLVNYLICRVLPPRTLPKLDFSSGIPATYRTVVIIPGMLTKIESAAALCERLELHYLANPDQQLRFALLTDWADAPHESMPDDQALLKSAVDGIRKLNERYCPSSPDLFFLFHRKRLFDPSEGVWMGWERKRGKIEEFNKLLRGETDTSYCIQTCNPKSLEAKFVLTLDADTVLPRDAARRLVATLAHPLNRAVISPDGRRVVAGYGIIQPRVSFLYKSGLRSLFARIFAGSAGIDPYSTATSDLYQDLFGTGSFTGKGLYDIDAFQATAGHAFPENHILSHDLIESNFARCGLATDIEVFDEFPAKYHAFAKREHRWIRGDWQLLPWLAPRVPTPSGPSGNPLTAVGRWKMFDNLRRSLVPCSLVTLLVLGWTILPGPAWAWSVAALGVLALPLVLQLFDQSLALVLKGEVLSVLRGAKMGILATGGQVVLSIVFLANQAALSLDAICRTLYRLFFSRKHLLEWETAAAAESRLGTGFGQFIRAMLPSLVFAGALGLVMVWVQPQSLLIPALWLAVWLLSPLAAWWVSRPLQIRERPLSENETSELRKVARKTWRFFETFVTAEENWLPPDNFQEDPKGVVAHRTSPTNKGLYLLAVLSAHDLGYLSVTSLAKRIEDTFETLKKMERFRGHFLNWYETRTLQALHPAYVSTVDSGNFMACLLALKNGLLSKADEPFPSPAAANGLIDLLNLAENALKPDCTAQLRSQLAQIPNTLLSWEHWLDDLEKLSLQLPSIHGDETFWIEAFVEEIRSLKSELTAVCPWLARLRNLLRDVSRTGFDQSSVAATSETDESREQSKILHELNSIVGLNHWSRRLPELKAELAKLRGLESLGEALATSLAPDLVTQLNSLSNRAESFADEMDFRFLYSETRYLFSIGYNVPLERLDGAFYDLLASEACLTSYLAVARGVVPRKHWFQLGRLVVHTGGSMGLLSWGGTMFEYLMPRLLLKPAEETMLDVAQHAAVSRQREYGRQMQIPWGISESGFYVLNPDLDYQYQSFGVPGLGLKRGLGKDLVIAPYATLLATMIDAPAAIANFDALRTCGGEGAYGFYEAIDFTPERLTRGERCRVVKSFMAHHQGMSLCAVTNRLLQDIHCRRLHAEPAVRAVELLLQERVALDAPELITPKEETVVQSVAGPEVNRLLTTYDTPAPRVHLLSNGQYTVMLTNAGSGFSTCRGLAITHWRTDPARDHYGPFIYIRDTVSDRAWSAGYQPLNVRTDHYEVIFCADKAEFVRRDGMIETRLTVTVAPDQDAEIRRVTIVNHDTRPHTLEVTSYAEIVLNDVRADLAHPAFGKLFLETEWLAQYNALLCRRRIRSADQQHVFAVHLVSGDETVGRVTEYESDRSKFLGRRRTTADPDSLRHRLSTTTGPVLDPVFSLRKSMRLPAGSSGTLTFVTALCSTREAAIALASHYHSPAGPDRAFDLAWARSRVELQHLGITAADSHVYQRLAGHILFPPLSLRSVSCLRENRLGQKGLWRFGISGDLPIFTVCISEPGGLPLARQALKAHAFWRGRGFTVDLVLIADRPASYREELFQDLSTLARASDSRDMVDKPGGVFVRKIQPGSEERNLLLAASRVVLYGERGTLTDQIDALSRGRRLPADLIPTRPAEPNIPDPPTVEGLEFFNGIGGFATQTHEYVITGTPPAPWTNVIANDSVGCLATDAGLGCTWVGNSQTNRLTPWSNDPVSDPPSEVVYIRDEETGHLWTPTPRPSGSACIIRHGQGYTSYTTQRDKLTAELTVFVPIADPVKLLRLRIVNLGTRKRQLSATFFADWVLGTTREQLAPFIISDIDASSGAVLARCTFNDEFGSAVAFANTSLKPRTVTCDRIEFLGRNGTTSKPAALGRVGLSNYAGPGLDPCVALMGKFEVAPRETAEIVFAIGQAADVATAVRLAVQYCQPPVANSALQEVAAAWDKRLSTITVKTPDERFNVLVNRWLLYQVLCCRFWGRTAFYQSGGAYGFRDQLQDVMALLYAEPGLAREHILRSASRQFPEGDVQHWWHPPSGRGVRTRFSDDFLWLPFVVAQYVAVTADAAILDHEVAFLRGPALKPEEQEEYFLPDVSDNTESLYQHCLSALAHGWKLGRHGLPLMGCGDWNDGMNLVGAGGAGESVWVGWFQVVVRREFAALAERRGDRETATRLRQESKQLREAVETQAWDGEWYLRAWFDDGTPLGSKSNDECKIDLLPQSWAVLAGGDPIKSQQAVDVAVTHLVDSKNHLVKLFEPPFDKGTLQPGYIKGYVPGIRENGGQYTHGAIWLVQALAGLNRGDEATNLWLTLCPISHSDNPRAIERYKVEPYVVAADVYGMPPHIGRGGWTWYTGSAAWLYRSALETILGFTKRGDRLTFAPRIPAEWFGYEIEYRFGSSCYRCQIENGQPSGLEVQSIWCDGQKLPENSVPLRDDGQEHIIKIILGKS